MGTESRNFRAMLGKKMDEGKHVCVGFDPDLEKFPACVMQAVERYAGAGISAFRLAVISFLRPIIEKTRDIVGAYKPNFAFFEERGADGMKTFAAVVNTIHELAPDVPIIGDGKRTDIGNTNVKYAKAGFRTFDVDASTVNPYFGGGSLSPFLDYQDEKAGVNKGDKGVVVLCRTSNPEAAELQNRLTLVSPEELKEELQLLAGLGVKTADAMKEKWVVVNGRDTNYWAMPFYQWVAIRFAARWNGNGNCSLVVGANAPQELADVRALVGDTMTLLLPGIGFQQKGVPLEQQVEQAVKAAMNSRKTGFLLNDARGTLYASSGEDFADAARARVITLNQLVEQYRK